MFLTIETYSLVKTFGENINRYAMDMISVLLPVLKLRVFKEIANCLEHLFI